MNSHYVVIADYKIDNQRVITLQDLDDGKKSLTNDAENVVRDITARYGKDVLIEYVDSSAYLDRLIHENGSFLRFAPDGWNIENIPVELTPEFEFNLHWPVEFEP